MPHVHLIDDDPLVRKVLVRALSEAGWQTSTSEDGRDAVEAVVRERPDVVVLDVTMPGPSGWTVLERLRQAGADVRVVMLTGRNTHDDILRSRHAGADDFVAKPVNPELLLQRLEGVLRRKPGERDLLL